MALHLFASLKQQGMNYSFDLSNVIPDIEHINRRVLSVYSKCLKIISLYLPHKSEF